MGLKPWLFSSYLLQKMHRFLSFLDSLNLGLIYANVAKKGISFPPKLMVQDGTINLRAAIAIGCHRDTLQPLKSEWKVLPWQVEGITFLYEKYNAILHRERTKPGSFLEPYFTVESKQIVPMHFPSHSYPRSITTKGGREFILTCL